MSGCVKLAALVLLITAWARSENKCYSGSNDKKCTYVLNHSFCEANLPPEDVEPKNTLGKVYSYAELKHDPRSSLPDSFTICSTILVPNCGGAWLPIFFNVLDKKYQQTITAFLRTSIDSALGMDFSTWSTEMVYDMIPPTFPNKWTKSCMAINSTSGSINWVVEGVLVMSMKSEKVKDSLKLPKDLTGKLILGATFYGGKWYPKSNKVTNLNIFSSSMSVAEMKSMTQDENCVKDGDYLAWENMEWILHGKASKETVDINESCEGPPLANLFHTPFPTSDSCMHLCENLGSRVPSVTTLKEWTILQTFLKKKIYGKGLNKVQIWLPITDEETEDTWTDINGSTIQNYTLPWVGDGPDGGLGQNCARVNDENSWFDTYCNSPMPKYACMCSYIPIRYLKLRGLCPTSAMDVFYKPMNDWADIRVLQLQGMKRSSIPYDAGKKMWSLNVAQSNVTATSKAPHASFTLGKHNWTLTGDDGCNGGKTYETELKMSGCQNGEFTCNDGQCVSMTERCNQLPKCRDEWRYHQLKKETLSMSMCR